MHDPHCVSVARHEAAHAVAAILEGVPFTECELDADGETGRLNIPPFHAEGKSVAELRKRAIVALAGSEAQLLFEPDLVADVLASSIRHDEEGARYCVGHAVTGEAERQVTLAQWRADSRALVQARRNAIERVANELLARRRLTADEIEALL